MISLTCYNGAMFLPLFATIFFVGLFTVIGVVYTLVVLVRLIKRIWRRYGK